VNGAYGITGNHGFDFTFPAAYGTHTVQLFGINVAGGANNPLLGSGTVTVGTLPIGVLDSVAAQPDSKIRIRGWAFDPDLPATAIQVAVYRSGVGIGWFPTGRARADVNSVFGITGDHGFDITIDSPPGDQSVEVYAINVGGGIGNPLVGRGQTRVGIAMGSLDLVAADGRSLLIQGWAFDPDQPNTAIQVAVYRSGVGIGWFPTGSPRPDVNSVFAIGGNHGFNIRIDAPPGQHSVEVFAINVGPAAGNPSIGSKSARVL
jgi:hypothetical protein